MPDPLSFIALGAAIGGGAGKFVEKAWDSGEKWIVSYFANHQEKAREKAEENSGEFLKKLGERVAQLERSKVMSEETLAAAQEEPDFSVVLHKAILSAAQTNSESKHDLLARLVAERLQASPESLVSVASKMACDAISFTTPNQLLLLGLLTNVLYVSPTEKLSKSQHIGWLQARLSPFVGAKANQMDYIHLEALSCLKFESFVAHNLKQILTQHLGDSFNYEDFVLTKVGKKLAELWESGGLKSCQLTSVGQMLGVMVSDQYIGGKTSMSSWGG